MKKIISAWIEQVIEFDSMTECLGVESIILNAYGRIAKH